MQVLFVILALLPRQLLADRIGIKTHMLLFSGLALLLAAAWRRRYLICIPILVMPFLALAGGMGVAAQCVADVADLDAALEWSLSATGPTLVELVVE